ncbi:uncharacterized protein CXQ87_002144 [Candidozyma duobushaemuli]|uniref:Nitrogen regulatory protein areA GATA-like domain-containing protein n=1 Tax=Candidozyma duobushaemuli TaxID=1231522 RepID=A0A2V1AB25_9ASCO|nr:uncharacterized protein CXQ87_002144 [[Candida] duobushaemulonis]PVH14021.1 hypothetical protein CXQ87_002144 [[Candida] duobushaemulonis]
MSKRPIPEQHLYTCWRQNNSIAVKTALDDISLAIPSSNSKRLENITWRRWYKDLCGLDEYILEVEPEPQASLTPHLSKLDFSMDSDAESVSSVQSGASSMNFDDESSVASSVSEQDDDDDDDDCHFGLKPALKRRPSEFAPVPAGSGTKKAVKFNYIVNSREFVNGISFDYDFLDPSCL